jgi:hypothetical protein
MAPLEHAGWSSNEDGEVVNGLPRSKGGADWACFKHAQELKANDVWRMRVEVGGDACFGIAGAGLDVERFSDLGGVQRVSGWKSIAMVYLAHGHTFIRPDISLDGQDHSHFDYQCCGLGLHIPQAPFDLAVRCEAVSNVPQIQFNDDGVWHDFAPNRVALNAGPWFPYLQLGDTDVRLIDHRVDRPKPTKSAGKTTRTPAAPATASADGAGDSAGAAADGEEDESAPPLQKKARRDESGGSQ